MQWSGAFFFNKSEKKLPTFLIYNHKKQLIFTIFRIFKKKLHTNNKYELFFMKVWKFVPIICFYACKFGMMIVFILICWKKILSIPLSWYGTYFLRILFFYSFVLQSCCNICFFHILFFHSSFLQATCDIDFVHSLLFCFFHL